MGFQTGSGSGYWCTGRGWPGPLGLWCVQERAGSLETGRTGPKEAGMDVVWMAVAVKGPNHSISRCTLRFGESRDELTETQETQRSVQRSSVAFVWRWLALRGHGGSEGGTGGQWVLPIWAQVPTVDFNAHAAIYCHSSSTPRSTLQKNKDTEGSSADGTGSLRDTRLILSRNGRNRK